VTVAFDRGSYSPALFLRLIAAGFDVLTYRKGRVPRPALPLPAARGDGGGREVGYDLADQGGGSWAASCGFAR
jgi:hypothetical protein